MIAAVAVSPEPQQPKAQTPDAEPFAPTPDPKAEIRKRALLARRGVLAATPIVTK